MITVLSGTSIDKTAAKKHMLITDDLEDLYKYNMTAIELFSNVEFKTLSWTRSIIDSQFQFESAQESLVVKSNKKQFIECKRFSFPMARIPLETEKKLFGTNVEYFITTEVLEDHYKKIIEMFDTYQNLEYYPCFDGIDGIDEIERRRNRENNPNIIRQWMNQFAIVEEDQFEIACNPSSLPENETTQFQLSNSSLSLRSIMNLVTRSFGNWRLFSTSESDRRHNLVLGHGLVPDLH